MVAQNTMRNCFFKHAPHVLSNHLIDVSSFDLSFLCIVPSSCGPTLQDHPDQGTTGGKQQQQHKREPTTTTTTTSGDVKIGEAHEKKEIYAICKKYFFKKADTFQYSFSYYHLLNLFTISLLFDSIL